jgi:hypothetical protein
MTLDNGWALIIATVVGVVLVWIGQLVTKHWGNTEGETSEAHERIATLAEKISEVAMDLLKHQRYVAENYVPKQAFDRIEAKLDRLIERQGKIHD